MLRRTKRQGESSTNAPSAEDQVELERRELRAASDSDPFGPFLPAHKATTETSNIARKIASSLVLQLSTRIASPGRKVSASTSHTAPRWVPILERENRSSYLQARLSNATIVWSLALEAAVRLFPEWWQASSSELNAKTKDCCKLGLRSSVALSLTDIAVCCTLRWTTARLTENSRRAPAQEAHSARCSVALASCSAESSPSTNELMDSGER